MCNKRITEHLLYAAACDENKGTAFLKAGPPAFKEAENRSDEWSGTGYCCYTAKQRALFWFSYVARLALNP